MVSSDITETTLFTAETLRTAGRMKQTLWGYSVGKQAGKKPLDNGRAGELVLGMQHGGSF